MLSKRLRKKDMSLLHLDPLADSSSYGDDMSLLHLDPLAHSQLIWR